MSEEEEMSGGETCVAELEKCEVKPPPRSASEDLPDTKTSQDAAPELRQPPKVRSNSHCFGSPITALLNRIRRPSSYTVGEDRPRSTVSGIISASQEGVSRATRKSIHGISSAFASLRGKKYGEDSETVYIFNFVSPTLFLYGKDLRQAASKKLAEWEKLEASRTKEEKELREMIARHFIVDCSAFIFLDNAGAASMRQVHRELADRNIRVYYAAARDSVRGFFLDLDESDRVPPSAFYPTIDCAVQVAKAYRDSPPHITVNGLSDEEMVEEDGITNENEGDELTKDDEEEEQKESSEEEGETISRH